MGGPGAAATGADARRESMLWEGLDTYAQWALAGGLALRWLITGVSKAQERWTRSRTDQRQAADASALEAAKHEHTIRESAAPGAAASDIRDAAKESDR